MAFAQKNPTLKANTVCITLISDIPLLSIVPKRNYTNVEYTLAVDTRPHGRKMRAHYQEVLFKKGNLDIRELHDFTDTIHSLFVREGVQISETTTLIVKQGNPTRMKKLLPEEFLNRIQAAIENVVDDFDPSSDKRVRAKSA